jgi:hypothetical protein
MPNGKGEHYQFAISLSVLNHLGRNLYRNFVTVLGEAISNSWDADAKNVWLDLYRDEGKFIIGDDGRGMTPDDFQNRFLKIGYSKRKEGGSASPKGRPFIGAKGIGKLALLSCAKRISVFTRTNPDDEFTGGTIDNSGLDAAITNDLVPEDYPLEPLNPKLIEGMYTDDHVGTIIVFEGANDVLRNSDEQIRKVLALSFRFSLIDPDFTIHVDDEPIGVGDLAALAEATQFLWTVNGFEDAYTKSLGSLIAPAQILETKLPVTGFIASVRLPRHLKIRGIDDRATVDLFVNGRLRERNIIRHIPTQRIVESYIYGQIHFDELDRQDADPFTSSREGVVEDDDRFQALLDYLRRELLPRVIDDWDRLRLEHRKPGDEENTRKTKKERRAANFVEAAEDEFKGVDSEEIDVGPQDVVDAWLSELRPDAEFNVSAYVDCFLSENLLRRYIRLKEPELVKGVKDEIENWRKNEEVNKTAANLSFALRQAEDDFDFLGMDALAVTAEGEGAKGKQQSLWKDAVSYKPVRNAVGHTGVLTNTAKSHLSVTFENIKARIKAFMKDVTK